MCFTAAFGTPAVCWHSYLLHLEDLIVLHGNRSLDCSFQDTEAAWAPAQPPGLPSLAAIPTHPLQLSPLSTVTGAAASQPAKHTDTPKHSLKTMVPPQRAC